MNWRRIAKWTGGGISGLILAASLYLNYQAIGELARIAQADLLVWTNSSGDVIVTLDGQPWGYFPKACLADGTSL